MSISIISYIIVALIFIFGFMHIFSDVLFDMDKGGKNTGEKSDCIFCQFAHNRKKQIFRNRYFFAVYDGYPVSKGHMLIIPYVHNIENFMSDMHADPEYASAFTDILNKCINKVKKDYNPDGFNIGMNMGTAAGQTIMHPHIHVIPRYNGDVKNVKGGVRGVIPEKQTY